ncbi:fimbrial protein [Paraburkholderia sp. B3]|uniref:fimbrial protein n=1 Tax=Paraburkholderia sp. B3 TaxID=3134791 RepID=UPI003982D49D
MFAKKSRKIGIQRFVALLLLFLIFGPKPANATCTFNSGSASRSINIIVPLTLSVPRDTPNGTVIYTSASTTPSGVVLITCAGGESRGVLNQIGSNPSSGTQLPVGTNTGLAWEYILNSTTSAARAAYPNDAAAPDAIINYGSYDVQFALVKTGDIPPGTTVPGGTVGQYEAGGIIPEYVVLSNPIAITEVSCMTPDVTVPLGTHKTSELSGVGTSTASVGFMINLNSCPSGINTVSYRIDPVTAVVNSSQSVVALDGSSTASGMGVQLLNSDGSAPLPLSSYQKLSNYLTTGGNYTIPLTARYYQTDSTVSPGTANSSMTLTMQYQ